jgi:hypothetical protein
MIYLEWYFNKLGTAINAKPLLVSPNSLSPIANMERCCNVTDVIRGKTPTNIFLPSSSEVNVSPPQKWSTGTCHITTLEPIMPKLGF